jgi:hypothetical protein
LVVRIGSGLGLDFTVHASMYGKVPFLHPPKELVVVVLHDPNPSHYLSSYSGVGIVYILKYGRVILSTGLGDGVIRSWGLLVTS